MYKQFKLLLEKNNITTYQVAKATGIGNSTFSDWKNGKSTPKLPKLMILAQYFNVPLEYFFEQQSKIG